MRIRLSFRTAYGSCSIHNGSDEALLETIIETDAGDVSMPPACLECLVSHVLTLDTGPAISKKPTPKQNKKASIRQEQKLADSIGGIRHRASGASPFAKGDVRVPGKLRGEAKTTRAKGRRITRAELDKIRSECTDLETPFLALQFCDQRWRVEDEWVMVPIDEWRRLRALEDKRSERP